MQYLSFIILCLHINPFLSFLEKTLPLHLYWPGLSFDACQILNKIRTKLASFILLCNKLCYEIAYMVELISAGQFKRLMETSDIEGNPTEKCDQICAGQLVAF